MSYGKVHTKFWTDRKVRGWSESARLLALYLLTGPHRNLLGAMRVPDGYIAADMGWTEKKTADMKAELERAEFIVLGEDGWIFIVNQLRYDPLDNPNQARSALKLFEAIDDDRIRLAVATPLLEALQRFKETFDIQKAGLQSLIERSVNPSETVPQEFVTPAPEPFLSCSEPAPADASVCEGEFEAFWKAYPSLVGNPRQPALLEFQRALKSGVPAETIIAAAARYAEASRKPDAAKVAHARTWLHQKRWNDWQRAGPSGNGHAPPKPEREIWLERIGRFYERKSWNSNWGANPDSPYCDQIELVTEWRVQHERAA